MGIKLFISEIKVMGVIWREGDTTAKHISNVLNRTSWLEYEYYLYFD